MSLRTEVTPTPRLISRSDSDPAMIVLANMAIQGAAEKSPALAMESPWASRK